MFWLKLKNLDLYQVLSREDGEGAINTIAIIAGMALIATGIMAAMGMMGPRVQQAIIDVVERALAAAGG